MSPPPPKPKHYALLIDFASSDNTLTTSINTLAKTLTKTLGWTVARLILRPGDAQRTLDQALQQFPTLSKNENDTIVIYYGGFSVREGEGVGFAGWWWVGDTEQFKCLKHTPQVNPHPALMNLCKETSRDILFIFHTGFAEETSGLMNPLRHSSSTSQNRPHRKIAVWNLIEDFCPVIQDPNQVSACTTCKDKNIVGEPDLFTIGAAQWLREVLVQIGEEEQQEVEDLMRVRKGEKVRPKSRVVQIMGDGFVLGRG